MASNGVSTRLLTVMHCTRSAATHILMWLCAPRKQRNWGNRAASSSNGAVKAAGGMGTDLVQAQKALTIAGYFVKEGRVILLCTPCTGGAGDIARAKTIFDFTVSRYIPDGVRILLLAPVSIRDIRGLPFELVHSAGEALSWTRTVTKGVPEVGYIPNASVVWPVVE